MILRRKKIDKVKRKTKGYQGDVVSENFTSKKIEQKYKKNGYITFIENSGHKQGVDLILIKLTKKFKIKNTTNMKKKEKDKYYDDFIQENHKYIKAIAFIEVKGTPKKDQTDNRQNYASMNYGALDRYIISIIKIGKTKYHMLDSKSKIKKDKINIEYIAMFPHPYKETILRKMSRQHYTNARKKIMILEKNGRICELSEKDFKAKTLSDLVY